jgi:hypothetical protein
MNGVRIPKTSSSIPWVAFGIILGSAAYGLGKKAYRKLANKGADWRHQKSKASMKQKRTADSPKESTTTSTQAETQENAPAAAYHTEVPHPDTAAPGGREEVHAVKTSAEQGTQSTAKKRTPAQRKTTAKKKEPNRDQPLNPKD